MLQLTLLNRPIVRHLTKLNLEVRLFVSGIANEPNGGAPA